LNRKLKFLQGSSGLWRLQQVPPLFEEPYKQSFEHPPGNSSLARIRISFRGLLQIRNGCAQTRPGLKSVVAAFARGD
jgi:hypothetical protein